MALQLENLSFGYDAGQPAVVESVSAELHPGRLCALIGPNAAGKSTLLRLMLGHLSPWTGKVRLDEHEVSAMTPAARARLISYVPQRAAASFAFTVSQVVEMGRFALPRDGGVVEEALVVCDLDRLRHRVFAQLSAGQQQRVLLARALAQSQPAGRLMLLDEPTSAMDLRHVHQVMSLLARLTRQRGVSVLVVLHDLNLAARYADEVWLMDAGRRIAAGPWRDVLTPTVLEPVYGVRLDMVTREGGRPVFVVEPEPARA